MMKKKTHNRRSQSLFAVIGGLLALVIACNFPGLPGLEFSDNSSTPERSSELGDGQEPPDRAPMATVEPRLEPLFDFQTTNSEAVAYQVTADLLSTSNWTRVLVENVAAAGVDHKILRGADIPGLDVRRLPELWITRQGGSGEVAEVEFDFYLATPEEESIQIGIGKGHNGRTELNLYYPGAAQTTPWKRMVHDGVASGGGELNRRWFEFDKETLMTVNPIQIPDRIFPRKLFAFYYPWYGTPEGPTGQWRAWDSKEPPHEPEIGRYDSQTPAIFRRHIRQARQAGIDGFILSWWGFDTFTDRVLRQILLPVALEEKFPVAIYYETANSREHIANDFRRILSGYGQHPAYMKVDGDPVIFIYGQVSRTHSRADWKFVFNELEQENLDCFCQAEGLAAAYHLGDSSFDYLFELFDGVHMYFQGELPLDVVARLNKANALKATVSETSYAATVNPGFDNSPWYVDHGFSRLVIDREGGAYYEETWRAAISSDPDWILLTSFNEWPEGTEIEPSEEYGDQYLTLTAELVEAWKEGNP